MPRRPSFTTRVLTLLLIFVSGAALARPLTINTGCTPPVSTLFGEIMRELGRRIDREIVFQALSAERSLVLVNTGTDDGECCRIPGMVLGEYRNLIRVPESVFRVQFVAFSKNPKLNIRHWSDLRPYSVATVTGWKILVNNISRVQPKEFTTLNTPEAMFRMLELDRIDIGALGRLSGLEVIRRLDLNDIHVLNPPLAEHDLYLLLHRRHVRMLPKIARALRDMKTDGTLNRLVAKVISPEAAASQGKAEPVRQR